jgi:hypothetical protein
MVTASTDIRMYQHLAFFFAARGIRGQSHKPIMKDVLKSSENHRVNLQAYSARDPGFDLVFGELDRPNT